MIKPNNLKLSSTSIYRLSGYLLLFLLVVINFLSLRLPLLGRLGTYLWILSFIYLLIYTAGSWLTMFKNKHYPIFTILLLFLYIFLIGTAIPSMRSLNGENTQEIACMLSHLKNDVGYGYNETCFFGYPARQYLIPALPSLLGRNLVNLNLGGSIYLVLGLLVFSSGIFRFLGYSKIGDLVTAIGLALLLHFRYFNHFAFVFEQSIYPFCFSLIVCGLVADFLTRKDKFPLYLFGFAFFYLIYSYTPSLALLILCLPIVLGLLITSIKQKGNKGWVFWVGLLLIFTAVLITSFNNRADIHIADGQTRSWQLLVDDLRVGFTHLFIKPVGDPFTSPFAFSLLILLISLPVLRFPSWLSLTIFAWTLATIGLSIISKGYSYYSVDFRLHRSMVVIPILITYAIYLIKEKELKVDRVLLTIFLVLIVSSGLTYHYLQPTRQNEKEVMTYLTIQAMKKLDQNNSQLIILGRENGDFALYSNFADYFLPGATITTIETSSYCDLPTFGDYFLTSKASNCYELYNNVSQNLNKPSISFFSEGNNNQYLIFSSAQ